MNIEDKIAQINVKNAILQLVLNSFLHFKNFLIQVLLLILLFIVDYVTFDLT